MFTLLYQVRSNFGERQACGENIDSHYLSQLLSSRTNSPPQTARMHWGAGGVDILRRIVLPTLDEFFDPMGLGRDLSNRGLGHRFSGNCRRYRYPLPKGALTGTCASMVLMVSTCSLRLCCLQQPSLREDSFLLQRSGTFFAAAQNA